MVKLPSDLSRDCLEIYLLFKERLERGVTPNDITDRNTLNIVEYTGRISDLRRFGYGIKNVRKNFYVISSEPELPKKEIYFLQSQAQKRGYKSLQTRCEARIQALERIEPLL